MKKKKQFKILLIAVFVAVSSGVFAQVKIGANPTQIETGSNLEVEASGAGSHKGKVDKVSGQLTIKDGTEGLGRVLTSDNAGGASWKSSGLVKATVTYTNDGVATVPVYPINTAVSFNTATPSNITISFPENGTYAVSWGFIGDFTATVPNPAGWLGVLVGQTSTILNHQEELVPGSKYVFSSGIRYMEITNAPVTLEVKYVNAIGGSAFTVRGHSGNNYNDWFAYKVF